MSDADEREDRELPRRRPSWMDRRMEELNRKVEPPRRDQVDIVMARAAAAPLPRVSEERREQRERENRTMRERFNAVKEKLFGAEENTGQEFSVETQEKVTLMPVIKFKMAFATA